jgi:integrase
MRSFNFLAWMMRRSKRVPALISPDDFFALIRLANFESPGRPVQWAHRARAAAGLAYCAGLWLPEILALRRRHWCPEGHDLVIVNGDRVVGEQGSQTHRRILPVSPAARYLVGQFLKALGPNGVDPDGQFFAMEGAPPLKLELRNAARRSAVDVPHAHRHVLHRQELHELLDVLDVLHAQAGRDGLLARPLDVVHGLAVRPARGAHDQPDAGRLRARLGAGELEAGRRVAGVGDDGGFRRRQIAREDAERDVAGVLLARLAQLLDRRLADVGDEARAVVAAGTHVPASESKTFKEVAKAWIQDCKASGLERTTTDVYEQRLRDYSEPLWGDRKVGQLTTVDAKQFYEDVLDKSRSHETVRRVRIEVGAVLRYAQTKGWVVKNIISLTPYKHKKKKRPPMPSVEEVQALIEATTAQWADYLAMLFVLIFCGLRGSELRALCWTDVDFKKGLISITKRADRWGIVAQPKSDAGTRDIVMNATTAKALKEWKLRCPRSDLGLVFPTSRGTVQNHANLMNRFLRLAQIEAGVTKQKVINDKGKQSGKLVAKYGMHACGTSAPHSGSRPIFRPNAFKR